jgi:hypothetical protein
VHALVHAVSCWAADTKLQQLICQLRPPADAEGGQIASEHRHAQGLRDLWGPFLCSHRLLEGCFTALAEYAPVVERGADCIHIPEDCSAMA